MNLITLKKKKKKGGGGGGDGGVGWMGGWVGDTNKYKINIQRELISAQKTSHKHNNKDLSRLR